MLLFQVLDLTKKDAIVSLESSVATTHASVALTDKTIEAKISNILYTEPKLRQSNVMKHPTETLSPDLVGQRSWVAGRTFMWWHIGWNVFLKVNSSHARPAVQIPLQGCGPRKGGPA